MRGPEASGVQVLWRARLESPHRSGSFRLLLRQQGAVWEMAALDPLGRTVWVLDSPAAGGAPARVLDFSARRACDLAEDRLPLASLGLPPLPVAVLPRLLSAPFEPSTSAALARRSDGGPDGLEWIVEPGPPGALPEGIGRSGRREVVRARRRGEAIEWLSSVDGATLTLTRIAVEALHGAVHRREVPGGFEVIGIEVPCDAPIVP